MMWAREQPAARIQQPKNTTSKPARVAILPISARMWLVGLTKICDRRRKHTWSVNDAPKFPFRNERRRAAVVRHHRLVRRMVHINNESCVKKLPIASYQ